MNFTINHTTHFRLEFIEARDAIYQNTLANVILLFLYLLTIVAYSDRFTTRASYNIAIGVWMVWMINTIVFYVGTIDINKSSGIDDKTNQLEIISGSFIIIQFCIFIMTLVCHKYDQVAMGKVRFDYNVQEEEENLKV